MNKTHLSTQLDVWANKTKRVNRINADADRALEPHLQAYDKKAEPIIAERDQKLAPLLAEIALIEKEIGPKLLAEITVEGAAPAPLETKLAVCQVTVDRKREIGVAEFIRAVPPRLRLDPNYNGCFSVLVGKVDKFLDAQSVARIVRPKLTPSVVFTLKND
jgi:hypothetical protein